jgi:ABC-type uncharacterized transport system auxiliary subunit
MRTAARCLLLSTACLLSSCIGLHSNQPVQQQYLLSLAAQPAAGGPAAPAAAPSAPGGDTLQVLPVVAAPGLAGDGVAVLRSGQRLDYYSGARWATAAPAMLQTLAIEALRRQGHFSLVESDAGPFEARYVLNLELTHFEADYGTAGPEGAAGAPTVRVRLVCTLGRRVGRAVVTTLTVNSSVEAEADRMQAVIAAFRQATDAALARMAGQILPTAAGASAAAGTPDASGAPDAAPSAAP